MSNPLLRKFEQFVRLSATEKALLDQIFADGVRHLGPREDIVREGETSQSVNLILSGWACRYKYFEDGRRQIISFFLPGDLCDSHVYVVQEMDHFIGTLTPVTIAQVPRQRIEQTFQHERIQQALAWETLVNMAIQREWTVSLGQRDASERLAHLLCEIFIRLRGVGLTDGASCDLPIKQAEMADALGLSTVHVNRTLQELRAAKLIMLRGKTLTIPDLPALCSAAQFTPNYLHLDREGRHLDAND